jgi:outer membrane protein
MNTTIRLLAIFALPAAAQAQQPEAPPERWAIGLGAAAIESPYAGEGERIRAFPLVSYEGDRVFLRGISGGVHLLDSGGFKLDAILSARLDGFDIDDLGRTELLANGLDPGLLSDRDDGLDAGVRISYRSPLGLIALEGVQDITGASEGYEFKLDYRYSWQFDQASLTAIAGASWLSADTTSYYYGVLDEEVARGVAAYSPGSAVVPRVGLQMSRSLGSSKWQVLGALDYQFLPDELKDSPLLEPDSEGMARVMVGLSRRF